MKKYLWLCIPMKSGLFFLLITLFSSKLFSQAFQRAYGSSYSETATNIKPTLDGNYVLGGVTTSYGAGQGDYFLVKVDPSGNLIWAKTYGGSGDEFSYGVYTCSDGGFILTGQTTSFGNGDKDMYLVRTDSDGNLLWSKAIGGTGYDMGWFVAEAGDGGIVSCGSTYSFGTWDGYLVKLNSSGSLLWVKTYGDTGGEFFYGMSKLNDEGYIIAGETSSNTFGSTDIFLVRTDSNGDTVWTRTIGKITEDAGWMAIPTLDSGFAVCGDMHVLPMSSAHNEALVKTDSNGNVQWNKTYGASPGSEIAYFIDQDSDGSFNVLSNTNNYGNGSVDFFLIKTNSVGSMQWAKTYGSTNYDDAWTFAADPSGGKFLVGSTTSYGAGQYDFYLVKTDATGDGKCFTTTPSPFENTPSLQTRSGTIVSSGGILVNANTVVTSPSPSAFDPCTLVSTEENENDFSINIFPNPFRSEATVKIQGIKEMALLEFSLYDLFGRKVLNQSIRSAKTFSDNAEFRINRNNLGTGIYFYSLRSLEKIISTGKIIIE